MTLREKQIDEFANSQVDCEFFNEDLYKGIIIGAKWADEHPKSKTVNTQEFIEKLKTWLKINTDWNKEYIIDEATFSYWCRQVCNPNYGKIDELVKYLEE